nr:MAG TPA: hypothetical protein [Caudoviricetes sp.]
MAFLYISIGAVVLSPFRYIGEINGTSYVC